MKKFDIPKMAKDIKEGIARHSPEILTGIGIAGMITTTVLAVRATPKALQLIDEEEEKRWSELRVGEEWAELTPVEKIKIAWKPYIPAAMTGVFSIAFLISANSVNVRRNAALATAYKLSETAFAEYKDKVVETIGENKEKAVKDKVRKKKIDDNPVSKNDVIITSCGRTLCYDTISGRYFESDLEKIKRAANELNRQITTGMCGYVSLNEFYDEIGLDHISVGYDLGWNIYDGLIEIEPGSHLADNGQPCVVIDYRVAPKYNYYKIG